MDTLDVKGDHPAMGVKNMTNFSKKEEMLKCFCIPDTRMYSPSAGGILAKSNNFMFLNTSNSHGFMRRKGCPRVQGICTFECDEVHNTCLVKSK